MGHVLEFPAEPRNVKSASPSKPKPHDYLTPEEMEQFLKASKHRRHGVRDYAMLLMCYRHGLRATELTEMRLDQIDLKSAHFSCERLKGSLSTHQTIEGDESRAIRAWLRVREEHPYRHTPYHPEGPHGPGKQVGVVPPTHRCPPGSHQVGVVFQLRCQRVARIAGEQGLCPSIGWRWPLPRFDTAL